ncbi:unnamed protein product [Brassica rapa]|uniref:Uncharacterized protein n=1 Tax=Brassica campestris TaxID=3711 RepID=A0A8D9DF67_BRACM|nr:unnamed protein product [Brassica rapa]
MCVRLCPSTHTGRPWLSISTHIITLVLRLSTLALFVDCLADFGPRGLSVQYTQDICGCLWLFVSTHRMSVSVCVCPRVCLTHRTSMCVCQHTQDICGCPCVSLCVRQHKQDLRGLHTERPWVSASTHRTSVAVHQCTQDVCGCPCVSCLSVRTHRTSMGVRQRTQDVRVMLAVPVDCVGDFGPRGLSVQYTHDVRGCPSAHTGGPCHTQDVRGCPCVSVSTHRTSVAVHQYTYQHVGPWTQHAGRFCGLFGTHRTSVAVRGGPWLSVSTHRTSVAVCVCLRVSECVRQHTQDIRRLWLSISTHISTLVLALSTLALFVDYLGDFGPPHTGRPWVSVSTHRTSVCVRQHTQDVRGCPCVSVSTHRTSVAVRQYTYQHVGPSTQHAGPSRGLSVQYTQDIRGCPSAHT